MEINQEIEKFVGESAQNKDSLLEKLKSGYRIITENEKPIPLDVNQIDITNLSNLLNYLVSEIDIALSCSTHTLILNETYRCLQYSTVFNFHVQNMISSDVNILKDTVLLFDRIVNEENETLRRVIIFLTNLVVKNESNKSLVWSFFGHKLIEVLKRRFCVHNVSALIYNIACKSNDFKMPENLIEIVLSVMSDGVLSEFLPFLLKLFINDATSQYKTFQSKLKLTFLNELQEFLNGSIEIDLKTDFIELLLSEFKSKSDIILQTSKSTWNEEEALEAFALFETLAAISAGQNEDYLAVLQNDTSFLIDCTYLLRAIHEIGKNNENAFTPIENLPDWESLESDEKVFNHPAFGFKSSLVRVLSNLAWKHKFNQDKMREIETIHLLLDCCKMDVRNPLLMQWAIFSMKNICENNVENQNVIASLSQRGVIDSATFNKIGLTLNEDDDKKIAIVPLPKQ